MTLRTVANRYELEEEIGRGGMAVVYRARDLSLNRAVAFKLLHPYLANDAENAARFHREAEAIAKLHHPNIVEIFDTGQDAETGSQYLVMELLEGPTLNQFIQNHPTVIPETALAMCCSLCDAIEHAHQANIIHRDIKPENIMFSKDGELKLMDFGIARVLDSDRMTASNTLIGSPAYMSPETIENHEFTFLCDIYSLGTVLYYSLTGKLPFSGTSTVAILKNILDNNYPPPGRINLSISKRIDRIVAKCLKPKPEERYQSAGELRDVLTKQLKLIQFENYSEIQASYFSNPDAFNQSHLPKVKTNLNEAAQIAVKEKQVATALEHLNTVLSYDPENEQAIALLKKLRTGDLVKKRVIICAAVLVAVLSVIAFLVMRPTEQPDLASEYTAVRHEEYLTPKTPDQVMWNSISAPVREIALYYRNTGKPPLEGPNAQILQKPEGLDTSVKPQNTDTAVKAAPEQPPKAAALEIKTNSDSEPETKTAEDLHPTTPSGEAQRPGSNHPRAQTPKKVNKTTTADSEKKDTAQDKDNTETAQQDTPPTETEVAKEVETIQLTQPVFPPDAYAFIAGKRYNSNANGDILLNLEPGQYAMTVTCKTRCIPQKSLLTIDSNSNNTTREIITLAWADATVTVSSQNENLYYVAVVLDDQGRFTKQFDYLIAGKTMSYNNFTPLGNKPIRLEVFAISKEKKIQGINKAILEREKSASTRIELLPGDNRSITF